MSLMIDFQIPEPGFRSPVVSPQPTLTFCWASSSATPLPSKNLILPSIFVHVASSTRAFLPLSFLLFLLLLFFSGRAQTPQCQTPQCRSDPSPASAAFPAAISFFLSPSASLACLLRLPLSSTWVSHGSYRMWLHSGWKSAASTVALLQC